MRPYSLSFFSFALYMTLSLGFPSRLSPNWGAAGYSLARLLLFDFHSSAFHRGGVGSSFCASIMSMTFFLVENNGFEPLTLCVQGRCSSQLS